MSAEEEQLVADIETYVRLHGRMPSRETPLGSAAWNISRRRLTGKKTDEFVHRLRGILPTSRKRLRSAPPSTISASKPAVSVGQVVGQEGTISASGPAVSVGQEVGQEGTISASGPAVSAGQDVGQGGTPPKPPHTPPQQIISLLSTPVSLLSTPQQGGVSPEQPAVPVPTVSVGQGPTVSVGQGQGSIGPNDVLVAGVINATCQQPVVPVGMAGATCQQPIVSVGMAGTDPAGGSAAPIDAELDSLRPVMAQSLMCGQVGPSGEEFSRLVQQLETRKSELDTRENLLDIREVELNLDRAINEAVQQRQSERERELILLANTIEKARLGNSALPRDVMAMLAG